MAALLVIMNSFRGWAGYNFPSSIRTSRVTAQRPPASRAENRLRSGPVAQPSRVSPGTVPKLWCSISVLRVMS